MLTIIYLSEQMFELVFIIYTGMLRVVFVMIYKVTVEKLINMKSNCCIYLCLLGTSPITYTTVSLGKSFGSKG